MRQTFCTKSMRNLKMNDEVYQLRRKVIDLIYEANKYANLPRINVRITENNGNTLGRARMGDNIIWIPLNTFRFGKDDLREVVLHEILHAVYSIEHKEVGLMKPSFQGGLDKKAVYEMFLKEISEV